jgi:hypothetical protein
MPGPVIPGSLKPELPGGQNQQPGGRIACPSESWVGSVTPVAGSGVMVAQSALMVLDGGGGATVVSSVLLGPEPVSEGLEGVESDGAGVSDGPCVSDGVWDGVCVWGGWLSVVAPLETGVLVPEVVSDPDAMVEAPDGSVL